MAAVTAGTAPALIVHSSGGEVTYNGSEPTTIGISGDSTNIVSHLTWSSWTTSGAVGHGLLGVNNCQPNCAQGQVTQVPATIDLGTPVDGHFTTMAERAGTTTHHYAYPSDWASSAS